MKWTKKAACLVLAGICFIYIVHAQKLPATEYCSLVKQSSYGAMAKTTVASPDEDQYDVKHVKLDISLSNLSTEIAGSVTTTAVVVRPVMPDYVFELASVLIVDSVKINGQTRSLTSSGIIRRVTLPAPLPQGSAFTAQVFYHGTAVQGNIFGHEGLNTDTTWGDRATFSMSEPFNAKEWWPCKQSLKDKIDSADIWITIPHNLKAGSNGLLQKITPIPDGRSRYEWKTRHPIAYYLVSVAVAPFAEYSFYAKLDGGDSVLIQNYIYSNPAFLAQNKKAIDSVAVMMQFLSRLLGDYPFKDEKYGHCIVPLFGGMEHQTMTTQGDFGSSLTVHELGHQWFGDNVTCATWRDIWLNEGFASYIEYLFEETYRTPAGAFNHMQVFHDRAIAAPFATIYVDDTTNATRIFDGALSYSKAAAVIHTLRFVINNDNMFFELLRDYQQQFKNSNAATAQFKLLAEEKTKLNLTTFFNQWIYKQGHPVYDATWNQVYDKVFVKIKQRGAAPLSQNVFETPLELKLLSPSGDSMVKVELTAGSQIFQFNWRRPMIGFAIDPNNWVLNQVDRIVHDGQLGLDQIRSDSIVVYPASTKGDWHVIGLNSMYTMVLTDMSGRTVWKYENIQPSVTIPTATFASGMYILHLYGGKSRVKTIKLVNE